MNFDAALKNLSLTEVESQHCRLDLRQFVKDAWPMVVKAPLVWNWHLDAICDHLAYISTGQIRFFMCNLPPRMSKSTICSVLWPVWDWLDNPERQWLTGSYSLQLSSRDVLASRNLMDSKWFRERYSLGFSFDNKLKRQYTNDKGGRRIATSTDSTTTGEGGDIIMLDDPHNAKEAESDLIRLGVHKYWDESFTNRMNQQNIDSWAVIGQVTHENDLFHHIAETTDMSEVVHLVLPNEYDPKRRCITRLPYSRKIKIFTDPREKRGELMCEARVNRKATDRLKRTMGDKYSLQYQQDPKGGGGNIIKKEMWREWIGDDPMVDEVITVWDTAMSEEQRKDADYSARTDWGIFKHVEVREIVQKDQYGDPIIGPDGEPLTTRVRMPERNYAVLLGAWRGRVGFPELRRKAKDHHNAEKPDATLIEKKVSGISLIQEFKRAGIKGVKAISIDHGGRVKMDMTERVNLVSVVFDDGLVYYLPGRANQEVIDEMASFPNGTHDDYVSTVTMALMYVRRKNELTTWEDEKDETVRLFKRKGSIYG